MTTATQEVDPAAEIREPITAHAPWRDNAVVAAEVSALRDQYSDAHLDLAEALCDRHPQDATAFIGVDRALQVTSMTYGQLADRSRRLASVLGAKGVRRGSRVGVLMGKTLQLPIVLLAIWRLGAVHVPLFTAFAGPAIATRVNGARAALIVVDPDQADKLDGIEIPALHSGATLDEQIDGADPIAQREAVGSDGVFVQLYTSGTTGVPKGVAVPVFAIAAFTAYMRYGLDVRDDDILWNVADPGWAYGLYYGIIGPLAIGRPNILLEGGFSAEAMGRVVENVGVTNLAASPTVYRALKAQGIVFGGGGLRVASSAGEPLTPDVTAWAPGALGAEVFDHWGQTEQGMGIVNACDPRVRRDVKPGSMGPAMPGFVAGTRGEQIVLSVHESPLMWFTGYVGAPTQTAERFTDDGSWYLTGDVGHHDGTDFFFASRDDDVILAAGYRIGPNDIESIIATDPAVAEVAVVGRPDEIRGEVVEAFVVLTPHATAEGLTERLQSAVRSRYGAHAYPRRVHVIGALPKTPSGKIQRFILRKLNDDELEEIVLQ
ncbi:AMP-binding protein [Microbacterium esteraromaticum]|uniref:AMP-binding protein n=1 Tax=Microbacterium esteraromaticum TaxID=57043 RepID=UPI001CD27BB0|nr:AMP-binding protein [Microbacterium esteraromaticum]MCA1307396.1 AMP-binding protein [Microbacterium esteraromaticum]